MKAFLLKILLCLGVVLVVNVPYVFLVGGNLRTYAQKYFAFPEGVEVLVLGDSHAARAWASNTDKTVYNFAYGSDNVVDLKHKFGFAAQHGPGAIKTVVLPFDSYLVSPYREIKQNNRMNALLNSPYLNIHLTNALPLIFDPNTEFDFKRFIFHKKASDADRFFSPGHAIARFNDQYPDSSTSKALLRDYHDLIQTIRDRGYEVVAVRYPLHPFYDSLVRADGRSLRLNQAMDSLAQANKLVILDFSDRIADRKLFLDQDHVNMEGSIVFMNELKKTISR